MAAAVASDKPPWLSSTPARVRTQITNKRENTDTLKDREKENEKNEPGTCRADRLSAMFDFEQSPSDGFDE